MPRVNSSAVEEIDYVAKTRTLDVQFTGGKRYSYLKVPPKEYEDLLVASSIGEYVNRRIKPRYDFRRSRPQKA